MTIYIITIFCLIFRAKVESFLPFLRYLHYESPMFYLPILHRVHTLYPINMHTVQIPIMVCPLCDGVIHYLNFRDLVTYMIFQTFHLLSKLRVHAGCIKQQTFRKSPSNTANLFLYFQFNIPHFDSIQRFCDCYRNLRNEGRI